MLGINGGQMKTVPVDFNLIQSLHKFVKERDALKNKYGHPIILLLDYTASLEQQLAKLKEKV